jgi:hypothetical protein
MDAGTHTWQIVLVPPSETISSEFATFLQSERGRIIPFVGAGLAVGAGVPAAEEIAGRITEVARKRGATLRGGLGFDDVCAAVTEQMGDRVLQEVVAEIISQCTITSTPVLELVVRCPSRIVITTNYDPALSVSARAVGLKPVVHYPPFCSSARSTSSRVGEDHPPPRVNI